MVNGRKFVVQKGYDVSELDKNLSAHLLDSEKLC